ncbi:hypothetical protein [Empedobacter falsenii]|uniref:hypothetical protein n=1 Tax=Empedobacter falsenii TaxID=343874 RepID=UPI003A7FC693
MTAKEEVLHDLKNTKNAFEYCLKTSPYNGTSYHRETRERWSQKLNIYNDLINYLEKKVL